MKKVLRWLLSLCFGLVLILPGQVANAAAAVSGGSSFTVCGKVQGGSEDAAVLDVQKRAVKLALARVITPDANPESLYQQIIRDFKEYVMGKPKVTQIQRVNNVQLAYCTVNVDMGKLQDTLHSKVRTLQTNEKHADDEVFFFVRITGPGSDNPRYGNIVMSSYTDAFQKIGFNKGVSDEIAGASMQHYKALDAKAYDEAMLAEIKKNMEVSIAVVGEITMLPSVSDDTATNSTAVVNVVLFKNESNSNVTPIGEFKDRYVLRRTLKNEAEILVLQKAAYNSAQYLAKLTLDYWQKR